MNKYRKLLGVLAVVVLVLIVGVTTVALAQDTEPIEPQPEVTAPILPGDGSVSPDGVAPPQNVKPQKRFGADLFNKEELDAALAVELGITVDELNAAREAAKATLLRQAVDEGKLTQEQVDQILAGGFKPMDFMRTLREEYFPQGTMQSITAETLGMTVEELESAHAEGKRLPEIAEEQGVDVTAVAEAVKAAFEEAVAQAVADGVITQEQADQLLSRGGNFRDGGPRQGGKPGGPRGGQSGPHSGKPSGFERPSYGQEG